MRKNKWYKRILPMLLSVAMLIETVPQTVLAAEYVAPDSAVEETTLEETAAELPVEESGAEFLASGTADGGSVRLSVDVNDLIEDLKGNSHYGYSYNLITNRVEVPYRSTPDDVVESAVRNAVEVEAVEPGVDADEAKDSLVYKWQQLSNGSYVDMAEEEAPTNAGRYQLLVTLPAKEGVYNKLEVSVELEILKAVLVLSDDDVNAAISAGYYVSDLKKQNSKEKLGDLDTQMPGGSISFKGFSLDDYVKELSYKVTDAHTGEVRGDEYMFQMDEDYYLEISGTVTDDKKDNYEIKDVLWAGPVTLNDSIYTEIKVTYTNEGKTIGKTYDGNAIDFDTVVKPEYTAKVIYFEEGENGQVEKELANAVITGTWCNASKKEYEDKDFVPVDAGTYYYKLSYKDEHRTYGAAEAYVGVTIKAVDIVIKPNAMEIYDGMSVNEVLRNVTYNVYEVKNGVVSTEAMTIGDYFWGVAYTYSEGNRTTQKYEPTFAIQKSTKDEEGNITWETLSNYNSIEKKDDVSYRVVFSGEKALYSASGIVSETADINAAQKNYHVDVLPTTIENNAAVLTVNTSTEVEINVDAILQDGKGATLESPITKIYDTKGLYSNKGEYKKATVTAKDGGSAKGTLTYTWQTVSKSNIKKGEEEENKDKYVIDAADWYDVNYNNVEVLAAPSNAGVYRLKISYEDKTGATRRATKYVYYVIKPQDAIITLTGTPAIYADGVNDVWDFLYSLQRYNEENTDTYVEVGAYPVTVTNKDAQGNAVYTVGEEPLGISLNSYYNYPAEYFVVEKQITEGEDAGTWVECDDDETFVEGTSYRLRARGLYEYRSYYFYNYNFGDELDELNMLVKAGYYQNGSVAINIKKTEAVEVKITVDESKLANPAKTYDGQPLDLTQLKSLVKIEKVADGSDLTAQLKDKLQYSIYYYAEYEDEEYYVAPEAATHGGDYTIYIGLETDATYRQAHTYVETSIKPAKLTVTPNLKAEIKAGRYSSSKYNESYVTNAVVSSYTVEGLLEGEIAENVLGEIDAEIYDSTTNSSVYILRSGKTYYVEGKEAYYNRRYDSAMGRYVSYANDYDAVCVRTPFVPARAAAEVKPADGSKMTRLKDTSVADESGSYTHTIEAIEGVPYLEKGLEVLGDDGDKVKLPEGNYFVFTINAPTEFYNESLEPIYANRIKEQGGYVISTNFGSYRNKTISVAFDASRDDEPEFEILWEKGYKETFKVNLKSMVLEADMRKAVAPKSLSFNGVNTKMAVGETQQLDVKITKAQMGDVILLGYGLVDGEGILKVSDTGFVTALSRGNGKATATVEVYACRYVNGVKERITGKEGKSAKVKITVSDVAAPKLSKVTAKDTSVTIQYKLPDNGYRREIYVLEGKKNVKDFEDELAEVQKGDYSSFKYSVFLYSGTERAVKGIVTKTVSGLTPNSEYTVYVRNVSGLRTLDDGRQVDASHAGSVKTFKTIKPQAIDYTMSIVAASKKQTVTRTTEYVYDEDGYIDYSYTVYVANLADKSAKVSLRAQFYEQQGYSDAGDYIWRDLPLSSDMKKIYTVPKLNYYVSDVRYDSDDYDYSDNPNYIYLDGYYYRKTSDVAAINNSGKITLKGKSHSYVYVVAIDSSNTARGTFARLRINATPDSVTGKSVKLRPGQTIYLSDYLEYKEKKTKIAEYAYWFSNLLVIQDSNDDYTINRVAYSDGTTDYTVTARKPGGKLDLQVTDKTVLANGGQAATIKLSTVAVDPVKKLKASRVLDDDFTVTFNYAQNPVGSLGFRVELKDARGKVIRNEIIPSDEFEYEYNSDFEYAIWNASISNDNDNGRYDNVYTWDSKTKQYVYAVRFDDSAITRLSTYTVTVTAIVNGVPSKDAKTKVKTTNIPVSPQNLNADGYKYTGGHTIYVSYGRGIYTLSSNPILKTGNTYTLSMNGTVPNTRLSDTLTWKSINTKVATIKVNPGTYSAQLKALKQGDTTIEVTSKITKKVVARWNVTVSATGEANSYYGDNEYYNGEEGSLADFVERDCLELAADGTEFEKSLGANESQWFAFTVPAYGSYTIYSTWSFYVYDEALKPISDYSRTSYDINNAEKNQKFYVKVDNSYNYTRTFSIWVSPSWKGTYDEIYLGTNQVADGQNVRFKAQSANDYVITWKYGDDEQTYKVSLEAGESYTFGRYSSDRNPYGWESDQKKVYTVTVAIDKPESATQPGGGDTTGGSTEGGDNTQGGDQP